MPGIGREQGLAEGVAHPYSRLMSVVAAANWRTPRDRPVRIAALLELYERNFRLLQRLVPELELPFDEAVSRSESDLPLRLCVTERGPYTAAFRLTYEFTALAEGGGLQPNLHVRVYRDAQMAEALVQPLRPVWCAGSLEGGQAGQYLDEQWGRNLLLNKWLQYLLEHGHGFGLAGRPRTAIS